VRFSQKWTPVLDKRNAYQKLSLPKVSTGFENSAVLLRMPCGHLKHRFADALWASGAQKYQQIKAPTKVKRLKS
jgi:hypothetical protein